MNEANKSADSMYDVQFNDLDGTWHESLYVVSTGDGLDAACERIRDLAQEGYTAYRLLQNGIILYTYDPAEERGPDTVADAPHIESFAAPSVLAEATLAAAVKVDPPRPQRTLPTPAADADRKAIPVWTGCVRYFPSALLEVAKVSKAGNDQHNPGQPLHWAQGKSMNQTDTCMRHQLDADACEGTPEEIPHLAQAAWRLLARLQLACQREGAPLAPGARSPEVTK